MPDVSFKMDSNPGLCLIFKAPGEKESEDNCYATELGSTGLTVVFVPVLTFDFNNLDELKVDLSDPESFSGIIFTSPRAVEAVVGSLSGENIDEGWKTSKNFAVGKATSAAVAKHLDLPTSGDNSGNADALAKHIITRIKFKSLMVYQTKCHPELSANIERIASGKGVPEYIIFFSPSGVKMTMPIFRSLSILVNIIKFVAIGPSTEQALRKENIEPYCTAVEPSAKGVKEAILAAREKMT